MTSNKAYLFGIHAVQSVLQNQPERVMRLLIAEGRRDEKMGLLEKIAKENNIAIEMLPRHELDHLAQGANHQGIIACCAKARVYTENDLPVLLADLQGPPFILILDGVQDPQNLGACFRSADAAGVHLIIAPKDKAVGLTPAVSKVASGAAETLPFVQVTNLVRTMEMLKEKGIWIYGAAGEAEKTVFQTDLKGSLALVLGAEGIGLRRLTRDHCDGLAKIPMYGNVTSLNVSVATGIFLFEAVRQRIK